MSIDTVTALLAEYIQMVSWRMREKGPLILLRWHSSVWKAVWKQFTIFIALWYSIALTNKFGE